MFNSFDYIYTTMLFLAIYVQVFFLLVFFENAGSLRKKKDEVPEEPTLSISFLIPCWNEESTIIPTIKSILRLDYPKHLFNIIVIDDGSTDATIERLQAYRDNPQIKILTKKNGGKHTALNLGLEHATTDLVASFDADTEISQNALRKAIPNFTKDATLMALGGTVLINDPKTFVQKAQEIEYQVFSFTKKMLGFAGGVLVVPGAFSIFRREVFGIIGGYKNAYNLEDAELTMRMHQFGMKVDHCHDAIVRTKGPSTVKGLFKQRLRWSHGFILNLRDYRKLILNRSYRNFGMFTLPMSIFTYVLLIFVFMYSMYKVGLSVYEFFIKLSLVGFSDIKWPTFDLFFINTKVYALMGISIYLFIVSAYVIGRRISGVKKQNVWNVPYFIAIYGFVAPFWVLKSIYSWLFARKVSWR